MPRRVQDIVPNGGKRSIRDIETESMPTFIESERRTRTSEKRSSPESKKKTGNISINRIHDSKPERMNLTPPPVKTGRRHKKNRMRWAIIAIAIILVIGGIGYAASLMYSKASFTIVPKTLPMSASATYVAQAADSTGGLTYSLITLNGGASTTIPATNGQTTSTKATGKVVLYNNYSTSTVRLIAGTRLANDSGLIYRLTSSVIIPGMTISSRGNIPGKLTTVVSADQPGQEYNLSKTDSVSDFKIVAYKGGPRYDTIFARIATPIVGGYLGVKKIVNPSLLSSTTQILNSKITAALVAQAKNNVPEGYIMFDNAYVSSFGEPTMGGDSANSAVLTQKGTVYGIIFKKKDLASKITSGQTDKAFGTFGFQDPDFSSMKFSIANPKEFQPSKKNNLMFQLKGDTTLVAMIPVDEIKAKLSGLSLNATKDVFKEYNSVVESSSGELVPRWAKVPTDPDKIEIKVEKK